MNETRARTWLSRDDRRAGHFALSRADLLGLQLLAQRRRVGANDREIRKRESFSQREYRGRADSLRDINLQRKAVSREPIRGGVQYYGKTSTDCEDQGS